MMRSNQNHGHQFARETGSKGLGLVVAQLKKRGAFVQKEEGLANLLSVRSADGACEYAIRTKTKGPTSSVWQIPTTAGREPEEAVDVNEFWVLVDLPKTGEPKFYIIPGGWFRHDMYHEHQKYLAAHGGVRPVTRDSTHHSVKLDRVCDFENRWDLLHL